MFRPVHLGGLLLVTVFTACSEHGAATPITAPTPLASSGPSSPPPPRDVDLANWHGDAVVLVRRGNGGCGWGTAIGEERKGVLWRVTIDGASVVLEEDMSNWPTDHISFSGTLNGAEFTAHYHQGDDYARWVCQFREATLVGRFSPDLSTFEAIETLVWGTPGHETVVERRWVAARM